MLCEKNDLTYKYVKHTIILVKIDILKCVNKCIQWF